MKVKLKNTRLAFPSLFTATRFNEQSEPKFSATLLVEKGSENDKAIQNAIKQVAKDKWGAKAESTLKKIENNPNKYAYKDGDDTDYDGFAGHMAIRASNKARPTVVNRDKSPIAESDGIVYSGCYVNAVIEVFAYDNSGAGISASLKGVQFAKDGEAFSGGGVASADEFEDISEGADAEEFM